MIIKRFWTFKIIRNESNKIVHWCNVNPPKVTLEQNVCLDPILVLKVINHKNKIEDHNTESTV